MDRGQSDEGRNSPGESVSAKPTKSQPEWADGLKKLYKEVVDEPLPDSFKDLLDKLDNKGE